MPAPLQVPSVPHEAAPASVHWFSGSVPIPTLVQVPSVPASAQDLHVAVQAVAQQIPCAQIPFAQSVLAVQVAPFGRLVQTFDMQTLGETQSVSAVHDVLQAPVPQVNGSQADDVAARQVPVPMQVRAGVSVDPLQLAAAHAVPSA